MQMTNSNTDSDDGRIATNLRTLLILEVVANSPEALSPTEINREIGLPKQSIHRLCQTLIEEGFLIRDTSGKRLLPAPRALTMAQGLLTSRQHSIALRQVLLSLSNATGETVNYVLAEPEGMTYLDRVETDWIFRIELPVGSRVPFHCTASGKCFLASLDEKTLNNILSTMNLDRRTKNTIVEKEVLKHELKQIRENGFALDNEELFEGMIALAIPVHDKNREFQSAVAVHGPTLRIDREKLISFLPTMQEGARKLSGLID